MARKSLSGFEETAAAAQSMPLLEDVILHGRKEANQAASARAKQSPSLTLTVSDWARSLRDFSVEALVVLGPDPFTEQESRQVLAVYPSAIFVAARALAAGEMGNGEGLSRTGHGVPLVTWQHVENDIASGPTHWRTLCAEQGMQTFFRIEFPMTGGRAFDLYLFSANDCHDCSEAAHLALSALTIWPSLKRALVQEFSPLTSRETECLGLAFHGLTARQSAEKLVCSERTVNFHLANAMAKMCVTSTIAAIRRACWLGLF